MRGSSIGDFPLHIQEQIVKKLEIEGKKATTPKTKINCEPQAKSKPTPKYKNKKTIANNIVFDSKKEAQRYEELMLLLKSGEISNLRLQVDFTLQEAYTTHTGQRVRAIRYKADFTYIKNNQRIVEDVKSRATKTQVYKIKKKMLVEKYGIKIIEI